MRRNGFGGASTIDIHDNGTINKIVSIRRSDFWETRTAGIHIGQKR